MTNCIIFLKNYFKYTLPSKYQYWKYKLLYGVDIYRDTLMASLGSNRFVNVVQNGPYLEITAKQALCKSPPGMIRLIPAKYNLGLMVEYTNAKGMIEWRTHCDYGMLYKMGSNREAY